MAQNGHDGPLVLAAGVNRLLTLLQAAGYTGPLAFTSADIDNQTGAAIYFARRSDVSAANGKLIEAGSSQHFAARSRRKYDLNIMYVYSAAGGAIHFSGEA